jgi:DNA-binding transcriptional ArsR family regulator
MQLRRGRLGLVGNEICMHPTQLNILDSLRQGEVRKFNELLSDAAETSDNLTYHLKQLLGGGFIESISKGEYALAKKGLVYLNNNLELNHDLFPTVSCMLELHDSVGRVLVMRKLKQPFLGSQHLLTFGVTSEHNLEEQIQQFLRKYHITAQSLVFKCNHRERVKSKDGLFIFDKLFVVFRGSLSSFEYFVDDREFLVITKDQLLHDPDVLPASKFVLSLRSGAGFTEATNDAKTL